MKSADGKVRAIGHGSGTLIGNKYVLTVGHNIKVNHNGIVLIAESIVGDSGQEHPGADHQAEAVRLSGCAILEGCIRAGSPVSTINTILP